MKWLLPIFFFQLSGPGFCQGDTLAKQNNKCDTIRICWQNKIETEQTYFPENCRRKTFTKTKGGFRKFKTNYREWDQNGRLINHYKSKTESTLIGAVTYKKTKTWKFRESGKMCLKREVKKTTMIRHPWRKTEQ